MILPSGPEPKDARKGQVITVTFLVAATGTPVADSIVLTGTTDSQYVRRTQKSFAGFRFRPATKDACPVPAHFSHTIGYR